MIFSHHLPSFQSTHTQSLLSIYIVDFCVSAAAAESLQSCRTLCDPIDGSPSGSSIHRIFQTRTLSVLLQCIKVKSESEVAQSCLTLSDPMDSSQPGSSVHGIFQARGLEWVPIAFSVISMSLRMLK